MRSGHFLISSHKTRLMPATATLCIFLTLLLLTCLALTCTTCCDECYCFHLEKASFTQDICGGSLGTEHLCIGRAGSVPAECWKNGISSSGGGEGWAGSAGEPSGCSAGGRAPLRVNGALHNSVMKELLRVEPPSLCSRASLQHAAMLSPAREGLRGDNILSKTLFLILPLTLAQIRLRAAQISSGKPLKRFKMSFSQFEGFCLANPVQGRLQASRPLLCC